MLGVFSPLGHEKSYPAFLLAGQRDPKWKEKKNERKTANNDDSFSIATNMSNNPLEDLGNFAKICPKEEVIPLGEG